MSRVGAPGGRLLERLYARGVGGPSAKLPEFNGRCAVYSAGSPLFVDIPAALPDRAPARERRRPPAPPAAHLRAQFVGAQLSFLRDAVRDFVPGGDSPLSRPFLQLGVDCSSAEDFVLFKRRMATLYREGALANGWAEPAAICDVAICLNPAVPGFARCTLHLVGDPAFERQAVLKRCEAATERGPCARPCSAGERLCRAHAVKHKRDDE